jgi:hypothetical protein
MNPRQSSGRPSDRSDNAAQAEPGAGVSSRVPDAATGSSGASASGAPASGAQAFDASAWLARQSGYDGGQGSVVDRRSGIDRREALAARRSAAEAAAPAPGSSVGSSAESSAPGAGASSPSAVGGLDRRRGPGRRLSDFTRDAEEGEFNREQFLFVMAIEAFKRANARTFPSWTDVLEVVRLLGYRKTCASELSLRNAEDWTEAADAPSNVRPKDWSKRAA